jgi:hypothetical protein
MSISSVLFGTRRGGTAAGALSAIKSNELDELFISMGLPPYTEMTRRGWGWETRTTTAFTPQVIFPATVANLEVKNLHATSLMVIDTIFAWQLVGSAVADSCAVFAQVGAAVIASIDSLPVHSSNGKASYTSGLTQDVSTDTEQTVVARAWRPFPGSSSSKALNAATPGSAVVGEVAGRIIVPPGLALHVAATSSIGTASGMHCGASWFLVPSITNEV